MSCLSIAILSTPKPNANPLYLSESILQFSRTFGLTIPQPKISSHLPSFDKISTSAEGSVKGKYEGLNLIDVLSPNNSKIILYIKSFKLEKLTFLKTKQNYLFEEFRSKNVTKCLQTKSIMEVL